MERRSICKHLEDADRLEIIDVTRITDDFIYYSCPLCKVEGKISMPAFLNKWEFWRILIILREKHKHAGSSPNRVFLENLIKITEYLYDNLPVSTISFTPDFEERKLNT